MNVKKDRTQKAHNFGPRRNRDNARSVVMKVAAGRSNIARQKARKTINQSEGAHLAKGQFWPNKREMYILPEAFRIAIKMGTSIPNAKTTGN